MAFELLSTLITFSSSLGFNRLTSICRMQCIMAISNTPLVVVVHSDLEHNCIVQDAAKPGY